MTAISLRGDGESSYEGHIAITVRAERDDMVLYVFWENHSRKIIFPS